MLLYEPCFYQSLIVLSHLITFQNLGPGAWSGMHDYPNSAKGKDICSILIQLVDWETTLMTYFYVWYVICYMTSDFFLASHVSTCRKWICTSRYARLTPQCVCEDINYTSSIYTYVGFCGTCPPPRLP